MDNPVLVQHFAETAEENQKVGCKVIPMADVRLVVDEWGVLNGNGRRLQIE
jgi:hypothetical protein